MGLVKRVNTTAISHFIDNHPMEYSYKQKMTATSSHIRKSNDEEKSLYPLCTSVYYECINGTLNKYHYSDSGLLLNKTVLFTVTQGVGYGLLRSVSPNRFIYVNYGNVNFNIYNYYNDTIESSVRFSSSIAYSSSVCYLDKNIIVTHSSTNGLSFYNHSLVLLYNIPLTGYNSFFKVTNELYCSSMQNTSSSSKKLFIRIKNGQYSYTESPTEFTMLEDYALLTKRIMY